MKHIHLYLFALISVILTSCSHACQKVELQEDTVSLLRNPCMGWGVYDDANDEVQNANITGLPKMRQPVNTLLSFMYVGGGRTWNRKKANTPGCMMKITKN